MSIAEKVTQLKTDFDNVYNAGYVAGQKAPSAGYNEGYEAGKKAEQSDFWEEFQDGGNKQNYYYAFAADRFTDANYNPKYDIICSDGTTPGRYAFYNAVNLTDTKVGIYANDNNAQYIFSGSGLVTIRLFYVYESTNLINAFQGCSNLVNLTMGGTIGNDLNLQPCKKLSKASIESVVEHLSDNVSGKTVAFSAEALGLWYTPDEWKEYIKIKPNWTFTVA